ncbi:MAG: Txe/YoeB family addiction module toxin [Candidatus Sumerlaeaceae bacterium]
MSELKKNKPDTAAQTRRVSVFHSEFREDLSYWVKTNSRIALRALEIVEAIMRDPFSGIGKPEPLKHDFQGCWSRRLTQEHRIVYEVHNERIEFLQARYHY